MLNTDYTLCDYVTGLLLFLFGQRPFDWKGSNSLIKSIDQIHV